MPYFVYIIISRLDSTYYKGFSENPLERLLQHNSGTSKFTSGRIPWELVYVEGFIAKRSALIREKTLKKYSRAQVEQLLNSNKNMLKQFSAG